MVTNESPTFLHVYRETILNGNFLQQAASTALHVLKTYAMYSLSFATPIVGGWESYTSVWNDYIVMGSVGVSEGAMQCSQLT